MTARHSRYAFLIYAHADKEAVHDLHARLSRAGVKAWLDVKDLIPGQNWETEIRRAILKSEAVIVCLSRRFGERRGYRYKELRIALERAKLFPDELFIIPVRLEECRTPVSLRGLQRVDLFDAGGYKALIRSLRRGGVVR